MGFRFRKSIKLLPGVKLNISKSGLSTSIGGPGATVNFSKRGTRRTVGLPGTGLSFVSQSTNSGSDATPSAPQSGSRAALKGCGFFSLLMLGFGALVSVLTSGGTEHDPNLPPATGAASAYAVGDTVYVTAKSLNGRSAPSPAGAVVTTLKSATSVRVVDRSGEWLKIARDGAFLWIAAKHVSNTAPQAQGLLSSTKRVSRSKNPPAPATQKHRSFGRKVCKHGQPCGDACISWKYTCRK